MRACVLPPDSHVCPTHQHIDQLTTNRYISHLLGHEGEGSILSYLKNKGWANELSAGPQVRCIAMVGLFLIFCVSVGEG